MLSSFPPLLVRDLAREAANERGGCEISPDTLITGHRNLYVIRRSRRCIGCSLIALPKLTFTYLPRLVAAVANSFNLLLIVGGASWRRASFRLAKARPILKYDEMQSRGEAD